MKQLSTTAQSTVVGGATAYLSLAPNLTKLTMFHLQLDLLPADVADAYASILTTGWTGISMLVVGGFAYVVTRIGRARESLQ